MPKRSSHFRTGKTKEHHCTPPPSLNREGSRDQERETKLPEVTQRVGKVMTGTRVRTSESLPGRERASPSLSSSGHRPSAWRSKLRSPGAARYLPQGWALQAFTLPTGAGGFARLARARRGPGVARPCQRRAACASPTPPPRGRLAARRGWYRMLGPMALRLLPAPALPCLLAGTQRPPAPALSPSLSSPSAPACCFSPAPSLLLKCTLPRNNLFSVQIKQHCRYCYYYFYHGALGGLGARERGALGAPALREGTATAQGKGRGGYGAGSWGKLL